VLYTLGVTGTKGRMQPFVTEWYQALYTRQGLDRVEAQMDRRGARATLGQATAPVLLCQGLQETLFPQVDHAWRLPQGPVKVVVTTGGHGSADCPQERLDWFRFHLGGRDTEADLWPALRTVDAAGGPAAEFATFPASSDTTYHLRSPDLATEPSPSTFTIAQRFAGNPANPPSALWDALGEPNQAVPAELRQDPGAIAFSTPAVDASRMLLGRTRVELVPQDATAPFQVTGTLLLERGGRHVLLGHAAAAVLDEAALDETVELEFPWVKAQLSPGDRLRLELASNDPEVFMPLLAEYEVTFSGESAVHIPFFEG
jgi:hypothetical protein